MPKLPIGCSRSCARASGWSAPMAGCGAGTGSCADPTPVAPPPHVCNNAPGCSSCGERARRPGIAWSRPSAGWRRRNWPRKLPGKRCVRQRARAKRRAANSRRVGARPSRLGPMMPLWPPRSAALAQERAVIEAEHGELDRDGGGPAVAAPRPWRGHARGELRRTPRGGAPGRGAARTGRPPGSRGKGGSGPGANRVDRGTWSPGALPRRP